MVDLRKLKPRTKKKVIKPKISTKVKVEIVKKKPIDWYSIVEAVLNFIGPNKSEEYSLLDICDDFILIGKRIKMTEIIKNENNIFQPQETSGTKYHYKYFHLINLNSKRKMPYSESPKCYPHCADMALHYMANFR